MKEKEIKEEKIQTKKRIYKPKKRIIHEVDIKTLETQDDLDDMYLRSGEVYQKVIKKPKQAGSYKIGKSFHVFFDKKPKVIHRFFTKLFLGWTWHNQK